MVKLVYCVRRRRDVGPAEFRRYWREEHGPLVTGYAKTIRARRYIQSHTMETAVNDRFRESRGSAEPYDGITEVWWDSMADLEAGFSSPEGQEIDRILKEDEARFVDLARCRVFMTEEHTIFDF